ncbi:hypothetical protein BDV29DRAFT_178085 [Aspergillus leporis]|jgi:hypothetical protein|uniref:gamma-glutamylcyclotransferase n=1 Tax=Aspergillus leporis TaxID=41062 RepID=A0A5N5WU96_9EURO|nr:hypothetical protein BDV29DRAFT_178085 [Aspergillus leporis]
MNDMITSMASLGAVERTVPNYYFAFGSNMCLTQMASRCPGSTVVAKGVLRGHRWQINERGVANVVPSKSGEPSFVEGVLFTVSFKDIRTLDRSEGISKQFYDKTWLPVEVETLAIDALENEKTVIAAKKLDLIKFQPKLHTEQRHEQQPEARQREREMVKEVEALVYRSSRYSKDGRIRSEYIKRMESAISDSLKLGIYESYLRTSLYPVVFVKEPEPEQVGPDQPELNYIVRKPAQASGNHTEQQEASADQSEYQIIERWPKELSENHLVDHPYAHNRGDGGKYKKRRQHQGPVPKKSR